jgi:hypothetical protein
VSSDKTSLGDYCKSIEAEQLDKLYGDEKWIYARIDGRHFHTLTKGMPRPFCELFTECMNLLASNLMKEFGASFGYVQSDEISLAWKPVAPPTERMFNGKAYKWNSVIPAHASSFFSEFGYKGAHFDARILELNEIQTMKMFYWRHMDARKNAVAMIAQKFFSTKELLKKHTDQQIEMLREFKSVEITEYPERNLYGTFMHFHSVTRPMTEEEKIRIPAQYHFDLVTRNDLKKFSKEYNSLDSFADKWEDIFP